MNGTVNDCCWEENMGLWEQVGNLAKSMGLEVRCNKTSFGGFSGRFRYVLLVPEAKDYKSNSKMAFAFSEAPYSRSYKPSIRGERKAIEELKAKMEEMASH